MGETTCPVCGEPCQRIGPWHESKAEDEDEFRTITHEKDALIVTKFCMETR